MPGFNKQYVKVTESDGLHVVLAENLQFTRRNKVVITIPKGTESDGASTPKILWSIIPPFGPYWKECLLHDYCYRYTTYSKRDSDDILLEAMEIAKISWLTRKTIYWGVRMFGQYSFNSDRKVQ